MSEIVVPQIWIGSWWMTPDHDHPVKIVPLRTEYVQLVELQMVR